MSKSKNAKKESKKQATLTPKEKKAAKRDKKNLAEHPPLKIKPSSDK